MTEIARLASVVATHEMTKRFGPAPGGLNGDHWPRSVDMIARQPETVSLVRAILTAMREPSEGMIEAGQASGEFSRLWDDDVTATWRAMIDHLLEERE